MTDLRRVFRDRWDEGLPGSGQPEAFGFESLHPGAAPAGAAAATAPEEETPPPTLEDLAQIESRLDRDPAATLAELAEVFGGELNETEMRAVILEMRTALESPSTFESFSVASVLHSRSVKLPPEFDFPGMDLKIPINPGDAKFETGGDAAGWAYRSMIPQFRKPQRKDFRWHNRPGVTTGYIYPGKEPKPGDPLRVGLFGDFGTGRYHSLYIAQQLVRARLDLVAHLGDVYYNGTRDEYERYFIAPLQDLFATTPFFHLHENHDMLSGSTAYQVFLDRLRLSPPQVQEGSYFAVVCGRFQLVGLDTSRTWSERGRLSHPELRGWLRKVLHDGRKEKRTTVLLTGFEPYEYGKTGLNPLLTQDLAEFAGLGLIDLWFWGNTHYCALFDRTERTPFFGSCIGHAGYPYAREEPGKPTPAPLLFLEDQARFPAWTEVRQDRGNNGYCTLELHHDGRVGLRYLDWMARDRFAVTFAPAGPGQPMTVGDTSMFIG